jgi:exopolysaccharide biosynthesis polyprenyl glycosylphosphotransferase
MIAAKALLITGGPLFCALLGAGVMLTALMFGLYGSASSENISMSVRSIAAFAIVLLPLVFIGDSIHASCTVAAHAVVALAAGLAACAAGRLLCGLAVELGAKHVAERVLLVGTCGATEAFVRAGQVGGERVNVIGQVVVGDGAPAVPLLGRIASVADLKPDLIGSIGQPHWRIDRVVVVKSNAEDSRFDAAAMAMRALSFPVHVLYAVAAGGLAHDGRAEICYTMRGTEPPCVGGMIKRALDVIVATVALVVLAPLLLLVAVLVRLESPGPALFRQRRLGRNSQPFTLIKFRSMHVDATSTDGSVQATRGDARVTRIGAILRKTSIDELPQLINVLSGSMSLVGPRPHPVVLDQLYQPIIEDYLVRLRVPPGMTGWAQVNGLRGETQSIEQMRRRVELDLEYIQLRSVGFDLWIMVRTLLSVTSGRNAY